MIESLTKEQEALIPEYVKKYTKLGLSTKPVSKERVEEIISQVYKAGKVKKPKMILHVDSPLAIFYAYAVLEELEKQKIFRSNILGSVSNSVDSLVLDSVLSNIESSVDSNILNNIESNILRNVARNVRRSAFGSVLNSIDNSVLDSVGKNVFSSVKSNVRSNIWNDVWSNVWSNVSDSVESNVETNIESNVGRNVGRNVLDNILGNVWNNISGNLWNNVYSGLLFGSHDAEQLSFYAFMLYVLKLKIGKIKGLLNTLELGWFYDDKPRKPTFFRGRMRGF